MTISVIILAKNEKQNIVDCIESVKFADEINVIDDCSSDNTPELARQAGARVFNRAMNGNYGEQYNFAISMATGDWILIIDADERVTPSLKEEIVRVTNLNEMCGYKISYLNFAIGQPLYHGGWFSHSGLRLFPRGMVQYEGAVHSQMIHKLPVKKLKGHVIHYTYPTWEHYFNKFNSYTQLAAQENYKKNKQANFLGDILLRPFFAFFKMYILRSGWRDGKIGFIMAVFHFFYTMVKYVKLYYMQNTMEDRK